MANALSAINPLARTRLMAVPMAEPTQPKRRASGMLTKALTTAIAK